MAAYNDMLQWQKEMREQFAVAGVSGGMATGARVRRVIAPGGRAVTYGNAVPMHMEATIVNEVEATPEKKP
jgi:hypothetical protein